ncbi:MAG: type II toxin-antitoxin system Phd/YefM family antitoxin [Pyrinomonadaceae bacterium]|jgi:antitoxin (DNA-binding transcriptional repressor) of toxin-antitoxin stability system|nr:hypothetical protein [Blastocatellia bacterium]MDQ3220110.1 hypothetical protein [Acidobacteriota bacterium]MDQ3491549.1 hypothetical protein [Acidobacteriota bacterium]
MTKTVNIEEVHNSIQSMIALTKNGDEVLLEENGQPVARIIPVKENTLEQEFLAWETASDEDLLKFEEELAGNK